MSYFSSFNYYFISSKVVLSRQSIIRYKFYKTSQQTHYSLQSKGRQLSVFASNSPSTIKFSRPFTNYMTSKSKSNLRNSPINNQSPSEQKNDFLQRSNDSLGKSNLSNRVSSPKAKHDGKDDIVENDDKNQLNDGNEGEEVNREGQQQQDQVEGDKQIQHDNSYDHHEQQNEHQQENGESQSNSGHAIPSPKQNNSLPSSNTNQSSTNPTQLQSLLTKYQHQLSTLQSSPSTPQSQRQITRLQTTIQILQIKLHLQQKLKNRQQLISFERINHLELIFKHYCTHIFKTGKHMTFDRLQYEKVHLTIDRLSVFLKDFNLTTLKMKDNRVREIIQKQQIIKLFKKISPNCRDLDFQQFILILQRLGQLYFDSKITYEQRKIDQRKQRLKIKQILQKKQKYKQQMLKKHQQKMQRLQKGINDTHDDVKQKVQTEGGENDDLIEKMINEGTEEIEENKESRISKQTKNHTLSKGKKSASLYSNTFKRDMDAQIDQKQQKNTRLTLTKQQKIQYFYEIINVDDIQSFSNKMRELNLPLFKIYAGKEQNPKKQSQKDQRQDELIQLAKGIKIENDDEKRLKELRDKLNERNQKIKHSSVPSLNKEEYELRKLKRSRLQEEAQGSVKIQRKPKKVDLTEGEINLSSLSKLAYENVNFSKFNPKKFYKKQQDDQIFLQQYGDSPVRTRKPQAKAELSKAFQNSTRMIDVQEKNTENLLQKLKQRQSQIEINQKKEEVSQMYRFNDRTQRQKRLIDKFLEKNK